MAIRLLDAARVACCRLPILHWNSDMRSLGKRSVKDMLPHLMILRRCLSRGEDPPSKERLEVPIKQDTKGKQKIQRWEFIKENNKVRKRKSFLFFHDRFLGRECVFFILFIDRNRFFLFYLIAFLDNTLG